MRALKSAIAYSGQAQIGTWLAAIVLNVLRDQYRAASRTESGDTVTMLAGVPAEDAGAVLGMMKDEMGACITGHLLALPERQRRVLVLHDMAGASHTEVAEALGISEGNAGIVLYRARAALRERLQCQCHLDFGRDAIPCSPSAPRRSRSPRGRRSSYALVLRP